MTFAIELKEPTLRFNAMHFVGFQTRAENGELMHCGESLHGHDFRVEARVDASLDEDGYVVDFIAARAALERALSRWNGRVLLARDAKCATYFECADQVEIAISTVGGTPECWRVPQRAVRFLNAVNATAEIIASEILNEWLSELPLERISNVELRLEEAPYDYAVANYNVARDSRETK